MGQGEAGEGGGIGLRLVGRVETLEVHVQGGAVLERVDPVALAAGHEHGLPHPTPAVAHADAEGRIGGDRRSDHAVLEDAVAVKLEGRLHLEPVARAAADERHLGAHDAVGTPDDLLLVAGQAVTQQQQHAVLPRLDLGHAAGDGCARLAQLPVLGRGRGGRDRESRAAEGDDDDA